MSGTQSSMGPTHAATAPRPAIILSAISIHLDGAYVLYWNAQVFRHHLPAHSMDARARFRHQGVVGHVGVFIHCHPRRIHALSLRSLSQ